MGENIFYILYSIFYMLQLVGLKKMGNSAGHTFSKNRCKTEGYGARSPCKGTSRGKVKTMRFHQKELWNSGDRLRPLMEDPPMIEGNRWFSLEQGVKNGKNTH